MPKTHNLVRFLTLVVTVVGLAQPSQATVLDLTTAGSSGTINGATFQTDFAAPTGTGNIDPFVRLQASNNTFESGFNTDAQINGQSATLDALGGNFTHSLLLGSLLPQVVPGVNGGQPVYEFFLDANQQAQNGGLPAAGLTLSQFQIFVGNTGTPTPNAFGNNGGFNLFQGFSSQNTLIYNMDAAPAGNSLVNLNTGINNGSGSGDLTVFVPVSLFPNNPNAFIYLYSSFGVPDPNGTIAGATYFSNNDGFEEWRALQGTPVTGQGGSVPEPTTLALLGLGFLAAGRRMRKSR